jgi:hypothetical protein
LQRFAVQRQDQRKAQSEFEAAVRFSVESLLRRVFAQIELSKTVGRFCRGALLRVDNQVGFVRTLCRRSFPLLFCSLTGNRLGLFVDHLPSDEAVFEGGVAVREAPPLFFLLLRRRRSPSRRFDQRFQ